MVSKHTYSLEKKRENQIKLNLIEKELPSYVVDYLEDKALNSLISTVVSYAYDLKTFFQFLKDKNPSYKEIDIKDIALESLEKLSFQDINEFQRYLTLNIGDHPHENQIRGINRRLSAIRGFFKYEVVHKFMKNNPTEGIARIKERKDHIIVRMNKDEVNNFLKVISESSVGSERQKKFLERTRLRDYAILMLLLNTGIRVSECVGLDLTDMDFDDMSFYVVRKGAKIQQLYLNEETVEALQDYIENERPNFLKSENEKALFLSTQKKRIAVRSIQEMVRKFSITAVPNKHLSPHKMRSTYGTALYNKTGDIRLVADLLGHEDINTTAKHYAADESARKASKISLY